jgi:UPF0716 protein FxsA
MALVLLAAFIAVPLIEIALFIVVGGEIGLWPTLGVVVGTAFVGTFLLRFQGFAVAHAARTQISEGQPPLAPMLHGVCLVFSAAFLITPGFFTDGVGFLLLLPPVRTLVIRLVLSRVKVFSSFGGPGGPGGPGTGDTVIDGDYQDVTPDESPEQTPARTPGRPPRLPR